MDPVAPTLSAVPGLSRRAIGVDLGGTNARVAIVDDRGQVSRLTRVRTDSRPTVVDLILDLVAEVRESGTTDLGVGVPGQVSGDGQRVMSAGFLNLAGTDLAGKLAERTGLRVVLDNDGRAALTAELAVGAASGARSCAMLTIGTGVGGAIADRGEMLTGRGNAGQLGHLTIDPRGPVCRCGRRGCLEVFASGTSLHRMACEAGLPTPVDAFALLDSAAAGESAARAVVARWAASLRAGVDIITALVDPELVLFGGGLGEAAARAVDLAPPGSSWYSTRTAPAALGDTAGVVGAALIALSA